jgi:GntR family transcriptional regulator, transcriptional repressor for pyruvate dehydrogenase complex
MTSGNAEAAPSRYTAAQPGARRAATDLRARKTAVWIAQRIAEDITDGQLSAGTSLAIEREMLTRFATGRGTLRESLRFLEMNGIITVRPGPRGGPVVSEPTARDLAGALGLFLQLRGLPFRSLIEVREVIEPELASLAAGCVTAEAIDEIGDTIDGMRAFLDDEQNFLEENDRFHTAVAKAAGNDLFTLLITSLHTITDGHPLGVSYPAARRAAVLRAHEAICNALRAGDADGARSAMRQHMREFHLYVRQKFPDSYERTVRWRDLAPP